jgi:glycosyltransferase involved in cell wall biosynthesis
MKQSRNEILYFARLPITAEPYIYPILTRVLKVALKRGMRVRFRVPDTQEELQRHLLTPYFSTVEQEAIFIEESSLGLSHLSANTIVFYAGVLDYWYLLFRYFSSFPQMRKLFWYQGLESEESYFKRHSLLRKSMLSFLESLAIRFGTVTMVPSDAMQIVLRNRYPILKNTQIVTLPNLVDWKDGVSQTPWRLWGFETQPKLVLGYMGGMSVWQCFEEMCLIAAEVEHRVLGSWFLILTREPEITQRYLERYHIPRYKLLSVPNHSMADYIEAFDIGFLLRRPHIVNKVSCPMKWLEYWRCGVPLVTTNAIDIINTAEASQYNCLVDLNDISLSVSKVLSFTYKLLGQRESLRQQLREHVQENWTWDVWTDDIEAIFQALSVK